MLVHLVENPRESVHLPVQEEEYEKGVQIGRPEMDGERLELRYLDANRVGYGMRQEPEDIIIDTGRELFHIQILRISSEYV